MKITSQFLTFKRQPHKMVKHNQTIRRRQPTRCFSEFDHFVGLAVKGLSPFEYIGIYYPIQYLKKFPS